MVLAALLLAIVPSRAQDLSFPRTITAGSSFSVRMPGSGKGQLYIVGPQQVLGRVVDLGQPVTIASGELYSAGHYIAVLTGSGSSSQTAQFDVLPVSDPGSLGLLAKPSRLPVNIPNGISGAVYIFDPYHNLITTPLAVSFTLAGTDEVTQTRTMTSHNGLAWTTMNSAAKQSAARFTVRAGNISTTRVINQVPGEPCSISIKAQPSGNRLEIQTAPVRDCSGNTISDGTIVTFTETSGASQSTVDAPLKRGIAAATLPAIKGAKISAASGSVMGNEIYWDGSRK
ncbi:MAG: hypothetical protein ABI158_03165 [Edaphobacter sp.]